MSSTIVTEVRLRVTNAQRSVPVSLARMRAVARGAARRLGIRAAGEIAITFIEVHRMRALNKRFMRHDWTTDVLSFRYHDEPACLPPHAWLRQAKPRGRRQVIGEILIAPRQAQVYARRHGVAYTVELSRYIVHGLLHWLGYDDRTPAQQRRIRALEDDLLARCGVLVRAPGSGLRVTAQSPQPRTHSPTRY